MWVNKTSSGIPSSPTVLQMPIEDLVQGEIFSLNTKSKRFVLASIDPFKPPRGLIVAHSVVRDGQTQKCGTLHQFDYADYRDRTVFVWGALQDQEIRSPLDELDRVQLKGQSVIGTVLAINTAQLPTIKATVLWDNIVEGHWITEHDVKNLKGLGGKVYGPALDRVQKIKSVIHDAQQDYEQQRDDRVKKMVEEAIASRAAARHEFKQQLEARHQARLEELTQQSLERFANDFKDIVEAGVLSITAGENNYEIGLVPVLIDGYLEPILYRVSQIVPDQFLRLPVAIRVAQSIGKLILKQYFLTREGYIMENKKNQWMVFSKNGTLITCCSNKKKALARLRHAERVKRLGF